MCFWFVRQKCWSPPPPPPPPPILLLRLSFSHSCSTELQRCDLRFCHTVKPIRKVVRRKSSTCDPRTGGQLLSGQVSLKSSGSQNRRPQKTKEIVFFMLLQKHVSSNSSCSQRWVILIVLNIRLNRKTFLRVFQDTEENGFTSMYFIGKWSFFLFVGTFFSCSQEGIEIQNKPPTSAAHLVLCHAATLCQWKETMNCQGTLSEFISFPRHPMWERKWFGVPFRPIATSGLFCFPSALATAVSLRGWDWFAPVS